MHTEFLACAVLTRNPANTDVNKISMWHVGRLFEHRARFSQSGQHSIHSTHALVSRIWSQWIASEANYHPASSEERNTAEDSSAPSSERQGRQRLSMTMAYSRCYR